MSTCDLDNPTLLPFLERLNGPELEEFDSSEILTEKMIKDFGKAMRRNGVIRSRPTGNPSDNQFI